MGRLIRRFIRCYNLKVRNKVELGTWASKITQSEAGQSAIMGMIDATALGGDVHGGHFGIAGTVDLTGNLYGVRSRIDVNTGIDITGSIKGVYIEVSLLGTGTISAQLTGMYIETYAEAGTTLANVFGIHYAGSVGKDPTGEYSFMRFSENAASTVNQVMHIYKGVSCVDIEYFLKLSGAASYWSNIDVTHTTSAGFLKVDAGGTDKYIQLFT